MLLEKIKSHAILIVLLILIVGVLLVKHPFTFTDERPTIYEKESITVAAEESVEETHEADQIVVVDVKGAVKHPGVYEIASQSRVNDVILKAGGVTEDAHEQSINLAEIVYDEMVIYVPSKEGEEQNIESAQTSDKIKINQATSEQLETLTGIGPAKAQAIINYRDENGPFQSVDDLLNVPGIGQKTLDNIVDDIQIP